MIGSRSPIIQTAIRAATVPGVLIGFYLLFAGHNRPGGGFAAGLVFGSIVALRVIAGLQKPTHATGLFATGMAIVVLVSVSPLLWGGLLLDQQIEQITVPVLGKIKSGSALVFDIGVTAIVVGLLVALLDGLGAQSLASDTPKESERR
jgi:multisubunit Na+/H+ antiporter MnhB subunit